MASESFASFVGQKMVELKIVLITGLKLIGFVLMQGLLYRSG